MKFVTENITKTADQTFDIQGLLTIRDVSKSISLRAELEGIAKDPWGGTRAGFTITGKINRKDYGLNWNVITEAGGMLVSEEIKIAASIQLIKA